MVVEDSPSTLPVDCLYFVFFIKKMRVINTKKKTRCLASSSTPLGLDKGSEHGVGIDITAVSLVHVGVGRVQGLQDGVHQV